MAAFYVIGGAGLAVTNADKAIDLFLGHFNTFDIMVGYGLLRGSTQPRLTNGPWLASVSIFGCGPGASADTHLTIIGLLASALSDHTSQSSLPLVYTLAYVAGAALWSFICFKVFQQLARFVIKYQLTREALIIKYFGIPLLKVKYTDVAEIRRFFEIPIFWQSLVAVRMGYRHKNAVLIVRRRRGLFYRIMISPEQPDKFVSDVKNHLDNGGIGTS